MKKIIKLAILTNLALFFGTAYGSYYPRSRTSDLGINGYLITDAFAKGDIDRILHIQNQIAGLEIALSGDITRSQIEIQKKEADLDQLKQVLEQSKKEYDLATKIWNEFKFVETKKTSLNAQIEQYRSRINQLRIDMRPESFKKNMEVVDEINKLNRILQEKQNVIYELEAQIENKTQQIKSNEESIKMRFMDTNFDIRSKIRSIELESENFQAYLKNLLMKITVLNTETESAERRLQDTKLENSKLLENIKAYQAIIDSFTSGNYAKLLVECQENISRHQDFLKAKRPELKKLFPLITSPLNDVETLNESLIGLIAKKAAKIHEIRKVFYEINKKIERQKEITIESKKAEESLKEKIENAQNHIEVFYETNSDYFNDVMMKINKISQYTILLTEKEKELNKRIWETVMRLVFETCFMLLFSGISVLFLIQKIKSMVNPEKEAKGETKTVTIMEESIVFDEKENSSFSFEERSFSENSEKSNKKKGKKKKDKKGNKV